MKVYMKEKKNKQKDFLLLYTWYNVKLKYKVLLLQDILYTPEVTVVTAVQISLWNILL